MLVPPKPEFDKNETLGSLFVKRCDLGEDANKSLISSQFRALMDTHVQLATEPWVVPFWQCRDVANVEDKANLQFKATMCGSLSCGIVATSKSMRSL